MKFLESFFILVIWNLFQESGEYSKKEFFKIW